MFLDQVVDTGDYGHLKYEICRQVFLLILQFQVFSFTAMYMGVITILGTVLILLEHSILNFFKSEYSRLI